MQDYLSAAPKKELCRKFDLIVLGSGAAGLTAAVTAAWRGLKVLVIEKADCLGGASAISGGVIWIPGNDQAIARGLDSSTAAARQYLCALIGDRLKVDLVDTYLSRGPEALRFLEQETELSFSVRDFSPDYYPEEEGSSVGGRALEVREYDGRKLGSRFAQLRRPPAGMLLFGGMMINRTDIQHFLNAKRSLISLLHCGKLGARYLRDRARHSRGTRLTTGNALIARLLASAGALGVEFRLGAHVTSIIFENDRVTGVKLHQNEGGERICANALVLATGGFAAAENASSERPGTKSPHWSMSPDTSTGDGLHLGEAVGGVVATGLISNFFWAPISVLRRSDGTIEKFPHLVTDRAKPGIIAINRLGRRFVNEADSYHRFVTAMYQDAENNIPCHLVCDATALQKYGMGLARPRPSNNADLIRQGYLLEAPDLDTLAMLIDVDPDHLQRSIHRYNEDAAKGRDSEFEKGKSSYNVSMGDPNHEPNPCVAPLLRRPFYAVRLDTGDLGSARGLLTDTSARVVGPDGAAIPGLYAVGNDMNSIMEGTYPGPGITLGPALAFGYVAGDHIAKRGLGTVWTPTATTGESW